MNPVRLLAIQREPLDPAAVLDAVADPTAGGVNQFVGVVRDHDHGASVDRLEYVAHPTALDRLREVCDGVLADFEAITALAAVHREGPLAIGDLAVVVAASAPHRDQAYAASRALIDRLKEQVPIWKHQFFADGTEEWVGVGEC